VDRRRLHKIAIVGACLVLIGGAVVLLRDPDAGVSEPAPPPPAQQTSVRAFADDSVILPQRPDPPAAPGMLDILPSSHRLLIGWGPSRRGSPEPARAAGYEVRWGPGPRTNHTRFVAEPVIQLDGLDNDAQYRIEVRTVDSFGQRSEPSLATGRPTPGLADPTPFTFVDRFDGRFVPEPQRWALVGIGSCTKASRGDGEDTRRMMITGGCGDSDEAVALRSRTPIRLHNPAAAPDGELGRFVVETDRPGRDGVLTLDLVPGPADLIGRQPRPDPGGQSGQALVDDSLPPGTIRVAITGRPAGDGGSAVRVAVAPGTPSLGRQIAVNPVPQAEIGVSVRWEMVLRTDGVLVLRNGVLVGGGDVVPSFTEATALVGFAGSTGGLRAAVDLIGFAGEPTAPPPLTPAPRVDFERVAAGPSRQTQTTAAGRQLPGVLSGQLRITLVPQRGPGPGDQFGVDIAGRRIPARPAVSGQQMLPGVRLPVVADIPADALVLNQHIDVIPVVVRSAIEEGGLATQVLSAELELTGPGAQEPASRPANPPLARPAPLLAAPVASLLDASGTPVPQLAELPRGRLVLDVIMDAVGAQQRSGAVAGLAGVEISMDNKPLAGIPTDANGPGIGGRWRIALNTVGLAAGGHTIQVMAVGVDPGTSFRVTYVSFTVG
jgi:hypothetical protein